MAQTATDATEPINATVHTQPFAATSARAQTAYTESTTSRIFLFFLPPWPPEGADTRRLGAL